MFLHPLGLLALLGVPAVLALHLFRRRFRPRVISALFLWAADDRSALSGRRRERLRNHASLWLELLAALLLGLAFAGPRACGGGEAAHLVVVLDDSASMGARTADGSIAGAARTRVVELIEGLPPRSRVTLVLSGSSPSLLAGPAAFAAEARAALEAWRPEAPRHDLAPAVALALQLAGGGSVLVIGDRLEPERLPPEAEFLALGEPLDNIAITRARRSRGTAADGTPGERVFLTVACFAWGGASSTLELRGGGELLARRELELGEGERRHLAFELPPSAPAVEALLDPDALPLDDRAVLVPLPPRTLALASALEPGLARGLGLWSGAEGSSRLDRWLGAVPDSLDAESPAAAHLVIARGPEPPGGPRTWALLLRSPGEERLDLIGPLLCEKRHPLLAGTTFDGVIWSADPGLELPGTPLVSAANRPLLTEERRGERRLFHFNLDPERSSLQRSPDWPILLSNLAELRRGELPGPERTNLGVGDDFVYRGRAPARYTLEGPRGTRELEARETLVVEGLLAPGRYRLASEGRELCELGISFTDDAESDLRRLSSGARPSSLERAGVRAALGWAELVLTALALGCLVLDWLVLARPARGSRAAGADPEPRP